MRISFCCTGTKAAPWVEGLSAALPEANISEWQPGDPQADHAVVWSPPQQFMDEQLGLKGIFNIGAGVDALLKLSLPPGALVVRNEDGGMAVQMAEFVVHAITRHVRELDRYDEDVRRGEWGFRRPRPREEFPVGIMGLGVLGTRVAQAVAHFGYPVLGWSRTAREVPGVRGYTGEGEFEDFLRATHILVCLLPLTPGTRDIMNATTLLLLRHNGYVINVARGAHLVDEDLIALVDGGHLAGAALDVFRTEPLPAGHPFWTHPKITITPHTSARTLRDEAITQIAGKLLALERGEPIAGVVDRQRGY